MKKGARGRIAAGALGLLFGLSVLGSAIAQETTVAPYTPPADLDSMSGSITSDGSSTVGPITEAVAEEFGKIAGDVEVTVDISGTGGGFKRFCSSDSDATDIQNASRPIKEEEAVLCTEAGIDFYEFQVAYDGVTVVVNKNNEFLTCLNVPALNLMWQVDSTVNSWDDLNPDFPTDEISLYGPGTDSGTYDYFTQQINGVEGESRTDFTPSEDDNVLVEGVAGDENALGYFGYAYYAQNEDTLNAVAVDGGEGCVLPSPETIQDGTYAPLSRPLYVYVNAESLTRPEIQEFMRFYVSNAAELATDVGFVASPDDVYGEDQTKLEAAIGGSGTPDSEAATS